MNTLSFGEIFVAIQAVSIYTTMRLIVYGREYFFSDTSLLDTMSVSVASTRLDLMTETLLIHVRRLAPF